MEILLGQILKNADGEDLVVEGKVTTLRDAARIALLGAYEDERSLGGEEKVKRYDLFVKTKAADPVDLTSDDIVMIKKLIGKAYGPLVVGQAWRLLEGKKVESAVEVFADAAAKIK